MSEERDMYDHLSEAGTRWHFSVADYHRMGEAGIFADGVRVELLGGEVVEMSPIGVRHAACVNKLAKLLFVLCGDDAVVQVQNPVELDDYSEPQPDLSLLAARSDFYLAHAPRPVDTLLALEVADTSLRFDRRVKAPLYAAAGVPLLWIIDLEAGVLEVHEQPTAKGYSLVRRVGADDAVTLPLPHAPRILVSELLP